MTRRTHKRDEVFGVQRDLPLNYITRSAVDDVLIGYLTREKHVVIFGSSKQGKTSLRKHSLNDNDYVVVQCSNKWDLSELHGSILKQVGYQITQSEKTTLTGKRKLSAKFGAKLFGVGIEAGSEREQDNGIEVSRTELELDPEDVNDVIKALCSCNFDKYIVLEDFHYLPTETQKDFAVSLKAFHEKSGYCFIVVGVWLEENRLIVFNGDLTGRIATVLTDDWSEEDLYKVIAEGEKLLNISFDKDFQDALVVGAKGSVYIVQEACRSVCENSGVSETLTNPRVIGNEADVKHNIRDIVNQQSARYRSFIMNFAEGFQKTRLEMYRWLLLPILIRSPEALEKGVILNDIRGDLNKHHPEKESLNYGNITQALQAATSLQIKKEITPIVCDYDQTNLRLNIVDRGFLVWLGYQDRQELLELANLPIDSVSTQ